MNDELTTVADPREGGLDHLNRAILTLGEDFERLDRSLDNLMQTLRVGPPSQRLDGGATAASPPARSVIEDITQTVLNLQSYSERQRNLIDYVTESIQ